MNKKKIVAALILLLYCCFTMGQGFYFPDSDDLMSIQKNKKADNVYGQLYNLFTNYAAKAMKDKLYYVGMNDYKYKGDSKNDYVSLSIYFWPNPETKNGLPYIGKDGVVNPESNLYDLKKFNTTTYNLMSLSISNHLTGNKEYGNRAVEVLRKWFLDRNTGMNPNFDYAQIVPGTNNNKGNVYGVIEAYNLNNIILSVELLHKDKAISSDDYAKIKNWFSRFLDWCLNSDHGKRAFNLKNNIGTAYDVTVARTALFVGRKDVAENIFRSFEDKRINKKILSDGSQPEELTRTNSFGYSIANLHYLLDMERLLKQHYYAPIGKKQVKKALDWLDKNYRNRKNYTYKQLEGWKKIPASLADLYWKADKCGLSRKYKKLYVKYKSN